MLTPVSSCGVCGGESTRFVEFSGFAIRRCTRCRAAFVAEMTCADDAEDDDEYASRYRGELSAAKAADCWALLARSAPMDQCRSVFDVGCGGGEFLDVARAHGLATAGLESSKSSALAARARGHEVQLAHDGPALHGGARFDLVTMWDVLEHLESPGQMLRHALEALAPGGLLVVLTPAMETAFDRAGLAMHRLSCGRIDMLLRMCWSREHLYRFDRAGLAAFLASLGMSDVSTAPVQLLSLRAHLYAGGSILPAWTGSARLNRTISRAGVAAARGLRIANKLLLTARAPA